MKVTSMFVSSFGVKNVEWTFGGDTIKPKDTKWARILHHNYKYF